LSQTDAATFVNMTNSNCAVVANFNTTPAQTYSLVVSGTAGGAVTGSASGLTYGSVRTITATPNAGYFFTWWFVDTPSNCTVARQDWNYTTVTVNGFCLLRANFTLIPATTYNLNVSAYPAGWGTANGSITGVGAGRSLPITATANAGYTFLYWYVSSGTCRLLSQTDAATFVNMTNSNCAVVANFNTTPRGLPDLVVSAINIGTVTVGVRSYGTVTTKNAGNGTAVNSTTTMYLPGLATDTLVPSLAGGAAYTGNFSFVCNRAGTYTVSANADVGNRVVESNESNNVKSVKVTCTSQPVAYATAGLNGNVFASITDNLGKFYSSLMYLLGVGQT
jgi:hypothetical protein